ncbi:MAG TPA: hypothetical protein VLY24_28980 [Bryobacteraceae bacterium]|nr:hypothetical protein [Bryobacteraceae bacterium]
MAEEPAVPVVDGKDAEAGGNNRGPGRSKDEIALDLMKFIAVTTGYGKGATSAAGFSGKPSKSAEEYADALFHLFERCRATLGKDPGK